MTMVRRLGEMPMTMVRRLGPWSYPPPPPPPHTLQQTVNPASYHIHSGEPEEVLGVTGVEEGGYSTSRSIFVPSLACMFLVRLSAELPSLTKASPPSTRVTYLVRSIPAEEHRGKEVTEKQRWLGQDSLQGGSECTEQQGSCLIDFNIEKI